jgi:chromosome segregation ATPase
MMNGNENHHQQNKEALVQKLQGALQEFRRERDQLHRSKELAKERCRLVQEEEKGLSKTVDSLKEKHEKLLKASEAIKDGLGPLEASVRDKTKEVSVIWNAACASRRVLTFPFTYLTTHLCRV